MSRPKLFIFSLTEGTEKAVRKQTETLFGDNLDIDSMSYSNMPVNPTFDADLILLLSKAAFKKAEPYLKGKTNYMCCERYIPLHHINRLYQIEPGSDVIISNMSDNDVESVMQQLEDTGIVDFNMIPNVYGEPVDAPNAKYAVVFGEEYANYVKKYQVIDLGSRTLDSATCIQIADYFGLPNSIKQRISLEFVKPSVKIAYDYYEQMRENKDLSEMLNAILNHYDKGMLLFDKSGELLFYNHKAQRLLNIEGNHTEYDKLIWSNYTEYGSSSFISIDGESYYTDITKTENSSSIVVIDDMKEIEKISNEYKSKLITKGLVAKYKFRDIIRKSDAMNQLVERAKQFAKSDSTIHISGESGCGKELIAQAIHNASRRKDGPFVAVNFAAITESLCESELFGYVEGSFTGAKKSGGKGLFELADRGTIFLDEIGDCSLEVQKKILRVIQERKVLPVGGNELIPVDIRIISATNQDLEKLVDDKLFRDDLFYRLNVLPLHVKPLRERTEDILPMFYFFLNNDFKVDIKSVGSDIENMLLSYAWKGNGRELRNIAEYIASCIKANVDGWQEEVGLLLKGSSGTALAKKDGSAELLESLEGCFDMHSIRALLETLNREPYLWTRETLMEALPGIPESRIKKMITMLNEKGVIMSRRGAGTHLTEKGMDLISYCKTKNK